MIHRRTSWAFVLVAIASLGCGDSEGDGSAGGGGTPSDGPLGSCDTRTMGDASVLGQCRDWKGAAGADLSVSCEGLGGVYSATETCPTDVVFSCQLKPVAGVIAIYRFYAPDWNAMDAMNKCLELQAN